MRCWIKDRKKRNGIMIKQALKRIIKSALRLLNIEWRKNKDQNEAFRDMPAEEIFDKIYEDGLWGKNEQGIATSGQGSHDPGIVDPYIGVVRKITRDYKLSTAVDLGCGDFAVGSQIYTLFDRYTACDISQTILRRNRERYQAPTLTFQKLNLAIDPIPKADIVFVRQVLQHLSNQEIKSFVDQVHEKKFCRYLLVTEHLPSEDGFTPNIDQSTGPHIRHGKRSGIMLHLAPFHLVCEDQRDVLTVNAGTGGEDIIKTILYVINPT